MKWLIWIALVIVAVLLGKRLFLSPKDFGAATNALLAERHLAGADVGERKRLARIVIEVLKAGGFPNVPDDHVIRQFNCRNRFVQLNVLALALDGAGIEPDVKGEIWHTVRNPFRLQRFDANIQAVSDRIRDQSGMELNVKANPLAITEAGLEG